MTRSLRGFVLSRESRARRMFPNLRARSKSPIAWAHRFRLSSLRDRFFLYLAAIHVVFGIAVWLGLRNHRPWLLAVEAFFVVSALVAARLVHALFEPVRQLQSGVQLLADGDFATRLRETGHPELDGLGRVYNRMVDRLREERIRSEEQEHFLRRVLASTPSGVLTFDFDGRIALANAGAAALLGCSQDGLVGRRLAELGVPFAAILEDIPAGEARVLPLRGRRRVKCQKGEFFDRGFPRQFVLLEELTEELRRSEKAAYDKLIRMMSHEVNNTAGAVSSLLQSCRRYGGQLSAPDQVEFSDALDVAIRRTSHMNRFMRRFADVVRIPPPVRSPHALHDLLGGIVRVLESETAERRIRIAMYRVDPIPAVVCDAPQLEQALVNVLRNAMEAIGHDGTITLRTGLQGGSGFLVVEDTGSGFAADVGGQLFSPFFTTKETGQGIGLTIVREILEAHGFEYSLESAAGEPTRFTILFR